MSKIFLRHTVNYSDWALLLIKFQIPVMEYTKHNTFKGNSNIWSLEKYVLVFYLIFQIYTKNYLSINGCYDFNRIWVGFISTVTVMKSQLSMSWNLTSYRDDLYSNKRLMVKLANHLLDVDDFSLDFPVFSTNKVDLYNIHETLLKLKINNEFLIID